MRSTTLVLLGRDNLGVLLVLLLVFDFDFVALTTLAGMFLFGTNIFFF
jgi:hypothetical protein